MPNKRLNEVPGGLRIVDSKVRCYARCCHFFTSLSFKVQYPKTKSSIIITFLGAKVNLGARGSEESQLLAARDIVSVETEPLAFYMIAKFQYGFVS
jgi:hypothetical protein